MKRRHLQFLLEVIEQVDPEDYSTYARKVYAIVYMMQAKEEAEVKEIIEGTGTLSKVPLHTLDYLVNPTTERVATNHNRKISGIPTTQKDEYDDIKKVDMTVLEIENLLFSLSVRLNALLVTAIRDETFVQQRQQEEQTEHVEGLNELFDGKEKKAYWIE